MSKSNGFIKVAGCLFAGFALIAAANSAALAEHASGKDPQIEFASLMKRVSEGWTNKDTELALSAFADDAIYTEPPHFQIYRGAGELRVFFDRITPGATMKWHSLWYNAESGVGAGEYSFKNGGRTTAVHGVAVVQVANGKIKVWREYQRRGDIEFEDFLNPDDKDWETTVDDL